eukprot:jgi/Undpi1/659/HiC_scaffold_10.g04123.m1
MLPWWRLSWEQGHKGKNVDPPTPPDKQQRSRSARTAGPVATTLPPGKYRNSLHRLSGSQECASKRKRSEGADMTRGKWMESTLLGDRDKRCLSRAWSRRKYEEDLQSAPEHP